MKRTLVAALLCLALGGPAAAVADVIPPYFGQGWVGLVCVNASAPSPILVQVNFDRQVGPHGGITLGRADALFGYVVDNLRVLSPIIGPNPEPCGQVPPSGVQSAFPGVNALEAAQVLSGSFQQLGFPRYVIVDGYDTNAPSYLDFVETLRIDAFRVNGPDDVSYVLSSEFAQTLLP